VVNIPLLGRFLEDGGELRRMQRRRYLLSLVQGAMEAKKDRMVRGVAKERSELVREGRKGRGETGS
jgi:hypothetical protein